MLGKADDYSQRNLIKILNQYLEWNGLPLRMNEAGVCNGLASVYAKYVLEGKEEAFFELLKRVTNLQSKPEIDAEINHFVTEVVLAFKPEMFNSELNQTHSMQVFQIDGVPLKSSFNFSIVTNDQNWTEIIQNLDLQSNEVMLIGSVNHKVSVRRAGDCYYLYEPNNSRGLAGPFSPQALVNFLHEKSFQYEDDSLGMSIEVITHSPQKNTQRIYPSVAELYQTYLGNAEKVKRRAIRCNQTFSHWEYAILFNDVVAINQLLALGFADKEPVDSMQMAMYYNSIDVLKPQFGVSVLTSNHRLLLLEQFKSRQV